MYVVNPSYLLNAKSIIQSQKNTSWGTAAVPAKPLPIPQPLHINNTFAEENIHKPWPVC